MGNDSLKFSTGHSSLWEKIQELQQQQQQQQQQRSSLTEPTCLF
jgi:hypothetical protein